MKQNHRAKWYESISITRLLMVTVLTAGLVCGLLAAAIALNEIYRQKAKDTWALVFLDLEQKASRLAAKLITINESTTLEKSIYRFTSADETNLEHLSGPRYNVKNISDLGMSKKEWTSKKTLFITELNGQSMIVGSMRSGYIGLAPIDFAHVLNPPNSLDNDSVIYLVNRSQKLMFSSKPMHENWPNRKLIQKYILAPLWQGQFEYTDSEDDIVHGFFQEVPGTNLLLFAEIPISAVLKTIIDPSKRFAIMIAIVMGLGLLFLGIPLRLMTRPVSELKQIAHKVGHGNFSVEAGSAIGEFGELTKAFAIMAENLRIRDEKIQQFIVEQTEKARLSSELKVASNIQKNFLPQQELVEDCGLDVSAFYAPANEVCGDWYTFQYDPYTENTVVLLIDVSGHGTAPGMLTAMVAGLFSELCRRIEYDTINQFMTAINRAILLYGDKKWHATAICLLFQKKHQKMTLLNAGHQPLFLKINQDQLHPMPLPSTPLGISSEMSLSEKEFNFPSGSKAFLYTDGLVEHQNPNGKPFGHKKLAETIKKQIDRPIPQIVRSVHGEWESYNAKQHAEDDTCFIGLEAI